MIIADEETLEKLGVISIKNFYSVNFLERILINKELEKYNKKYFGPEPHTKRGYKGQNYALSDCKTHHPNLKDNKVEPYSLVLGPRRCDSSCKNNEYNSCLKSKILNKFGKAVRKKLQKKLNEIFGENNVLLIKRPIGCYRSTKNDFACIPHKHVRTATVVTVFYYQATSKKDGIVFMKDDDSTEYGHYIDQNELLIFSSNLTHYPMIPSSNRRIRYSINIECNDIRLKGSEKFPTINPLTD